MRKFYFGILTLVLAGVATVAFIILQVDFSGPLPQSPFTVAKETTVLTAPVLSDGYVDYVAAVRADLARGVTPETNAAAVFWANVSPNWRGETEFRAEFYYDLGIAPPAHASNGSPLGVVDSYTWIRNQHPDYTDDEVYDVYTAMVDVTAGVNLWRAKPTDHDFSALTRIYVQDQTAALDRIADGLKRPHFYEPWFNSLHGPGGMDRVYRDVASTLLTRAKLAMRDGQTERAIQDVETILLLDRRIREIPRLTIVAQADAITGYAADGGWRGDVPPNPRTPSRRLVATSASHCGTRCGGNSGHPQITLTTLRYALLLDGNVSRERH